MKIAGEHRKIETYAYELLKRAMFNDLLTLSTKWAETGLSKIQSHGYEDAKICRSTLRCDGNFYTYIVTKSTLRDAIWKKL